jgi:uncharacterized protein YbaP (TraB family)
VLLRASFYTSHSFKEKTKNNIMIYRWISTFSVFWLSLLYLQATPEAPSTSTLPADTLEHALLWKIEHPNIDGESYLFGTIHMIAAKDYFLPQGLLTAIDQTDEIVFEIDMNAMSDMSQMMGMMSKLTMEGDTTLKMLLSTEDYAYVTSYFREKGLPIFFLEKIKPMFLSAIASMEGEVPSGANGMPDLSAALGADMKSYEMELNSIAQSAAKEVSGLETIDLQMSLFHRISYNKQAEYLVESIRQTENGGIMEEGIFEMYKSQNINKMAESLSSDGSMDGLEEALLSERNISWIPLIRKQMEQSSTLFAVGAGHLGGSKGVIQLLRAEGFTVTPVIP